VDPGDVVTGGSRASFDLRLAGKALLVCRDAQVDAGDFDRSMVRWGVLHLTNSKTGGQDDEAPIFFGYRSIGYSSWPQQQLGRDSAKESLRQFESAKLAELCISSSTVSACTKPASSFTVKSSTQAPTPKRLGSLASLPCRFFRLRQVKAYMALKEMTERSRPPSALPATQAGSLHHRRGDGE
jgi:hypothetical protein